MFSSIPTGMEKTPHPAFTHLVEIMATLRGPNGCPWDREQTPESLTPYLIEETYEVLEALEAKDWPAFKEELGDLLLQIVFHAQLMTEAGLFAIDDVAQAIADKLVRRHPHVFGDVKVKDAGEVVQNWVKIKAAEKADKADRSILAGVPHAAPALVQAQRLGEKAARVGFDWSSAAEVFKKVEEETQELNAALSQEAEQQEHELGDLLFALTNLARHLNLDAETALRKAGRRFNARFRYLETQLAQNGEDIHYTSSARLEKLWQEAKRVLGKHGEESADLILPTSPYQQGKADNPDADRQ
jgi:tetrapyrrole methylase family protein/MazG family protein